eukprot:snap_masked-scaffold_12-processed-gene-6.33-mRNA-1 protein AED:0.74 eAED:0.74 QI:0/-1/0/1/-1/1/1/0/303
MNKNQGTNDAPQTPTTQNWRHIRNEFKLSALQLTLDSCSNESILSSLSAKGCLDPSYSNEFTQVPKSTGYTVLSLQSHPGFFLLPELISDSLCTKITSQSMHTYPMPPYRTNIDSHAHREKKPKLTWASLGYLFDFSSRTYSCQPTQFPCELSALSKIVADLISETNTSSFRGETAIVNYYESGKQMGAHVDESEEEEEQPVISLSLGCSCVFLLGGLEKENKVVPILLREGDVVVLSGMNRFAYHGVANVFPWKIKSVKKLYGRQIKPYDVGLDKLETDESECKSFLIKKRVNINIRQVKKK